MKFFPRGMLILPTSTYIRIILLALPLRYIFDLICFFSKQVCRMKGYDLPVQTPKAIFWDWVGSLV